MELRLVRSNLNDERTIGSLYVNNVFECFTLEDRDRKLEIGGVKVKTKTAIPLGVYNVVITMSNRFKKLLPLVENVPQFEGIRIHPGNTEADTEGCILVGTIRGTEANAVLNSRATFAKLLPKLQAAIKAGEKVSLTVERA